MANKPKLPGNLEKWLQRLSHQEEGEILTFAKDLIRVTQPINYLAVFLFWLFFFISEQLTILEK